MSGAPVVFGWKEVVALPEFGITRLRAKLDTGARSAALDVEELQQGPGHRLSFVVLVGSHRAPRRVPVVATQVHERRVRDTRARPEVRPVVRTRLVCGPLDREVDITLTSRSGMNFRMLLGRLTLEDVALVDPARGYLQTRPPAVGRRGDGTGPGRTGPGTGPGGAGAGSATEAAGGRS